MTRSLRIQTTARPAFYVRERDQLDAEADRLADLASDPTQPAHVVREALRAAASYATAAAADNAAQMGVSA